MKKIGLLIMVLVLALGSLGVGYAMWYDRIYIDGNIEAGDVCIQWETITNMDACPRGPVSWDPVNKIWYYDPVNGSYYFGNQDYKLDVAAITGNLIDGWPLKGILKEPYYRVDKNVACTTVEGLYTNSVTVTVYNAYPLYFNDFEVEFCNCGNIPVVLQSIVITANNFTLANQPWANATYPGNGGEIWVSVTNGIGTQVDPGGCKAASVKLVVQQSAEQGETYSFTITWTVIQWNEYQD